VLLVHTDRVRYDVLAKGHRAMRNPGQVAVSSLVSPVRGWFGFPRVLGASMMMHGDLGYQYFSSGR